MSDMNYFKIASLEDLLGHEWSYNGFNFKISGKAIDELKQDKVDPFYHLFHTNAVAINGKDEFDNEIRRISLKNLCELKFYGLDVEYTPEITEEEYKYLTLETYFARDESGCLYEYNSEPKLGGSQWEKTTKDDAKELNYGLFPFITWQSKKCWKKSELLKGYKGDKHEISM